MRYTYPAILEENELGGYDVWFPDFEECYTQGDDVEDAIDMAAEAMELVIESYIDSGRELPTPSFDASVPASGMLVAVSTAVDTESKLVSSHDAAKMLDVSDARVRQLIGSGRLASKKQGRDNYVYLWSIRERMNEPRKVGRPRKTAV